MFIVQMARQSKSIVNLGNPMCQWQIMTNKPRAYAMYSKTNEENIHATLYLEEKPIVVSNPDVLLHFRSLPFPPCSKTPSMPHSSKSAPRKL